MPRKLSAGEYQELGKEYYRKKEYQKALDAFTNAVNADDGSDITLLDNRAATYEKLENNTAALKDAKAMIQLRKKDPRGYLRTAKVLINMGKKETALNIYQYGLRNIPATSTEYELLQGMHDKLTRHLAPPKSVDPFSTLPVELADMVLSYLTFRDIVRCLRVSKQWKQFLIARASLWTDIDLSLARGSVKPQFIRDCVRRSHSKVKRVVLHRLDPRDILRAMAIACKELEIVEILSLSGSVAGESLVEMARFAKSLGTLTVSKHVAITWDAITRILKYRPTLRVAEFRCIRAAPGRSLDTSEWPELPNLESLTLALEEPGDQNSPNAHLNLDIVPLAPKLEKLTMSGTQSPQYAWALGRYTELEVLRSGCLLFPRLPPTLRALRFDCAGLRLLEESLENAQHMRLPVLEELELHTVADVPPFLIINLLEANNVAGDEAVPVVPSKLKKLAYTVRNSQERDLEIILQLPRLSDLEVLDLTESGVDDQIAEEILRFRHLTHLNLSRNPITGVALKALILGLPHLRWLKVEWCTQIGLDAIQWARSQKKVEVLYKNAEKKSTGKRVHV